MIVVVAAVIERDGRFLLTRRQAGVHLEGLWEFPGGKVDPQETHADALRRELLEELAADVTVGEQVFEVVHTYPERTVKLHFYRCGLEGTPSPQMGQEMRWVDRGALAGLPFPDADRHLVERLSNAAPAGVTVPRVFGRVDRGRGPLLLVVGGLHGNEPAGALALQRVFARLDGYDGEDVAGTFVGLAGNLKALARNQRFVREDLNRIWKPDRLARVRASAVPLENEDEELLSLDRELTAAIGRANGPVTVFDVHSVSGPGPAFVTVDDTLRNRALAFQIPAPCVLGLEEELEGTLTDYFVNQGCASFGFECGQLVDPASVDRAEAAIWIVAEAAGVLRKGRWPEVARARVLLEEHSGELARVVEVRHRHAISTGEQFRMHPGFSSFQPVRRNQLLASNDRGPITAPLEGLLLMPLYQGQGSDGFFIVRPVRAAWLSVSAVLRRTPVRRMLGWLPGVTRHPDRAGSYVIDTRRARWLAPQVFHLLGFKRRGRTATGGLVMAPREP